MKFRILGTIKFRWQEWNLLFLNLSCFASQMYNVLRWSFLLRYSHGKMEVAISSIPAGKNQKKTARPIHKYMPVHAAHCSIRWAIGRALFAAFLSIEVYSLFQKHNTDKPEMICYIFWKNSFLHIICTVLIFLWCYCISSNLIYPFVRKSL